MTLIDLPFAQMNGESPDPKIGSPRIRRITNGRMDDVGSVVRLPGWVETQVLGSQIPLWGTDDLLMVPNDQTGQAEVFGGTPSDDDSRGYISVGGMVRRVPGLYAGNAGYSSVALISQGESLFWLASVATDGKVHIVPFSSPMAVGEISAGEMMTLGTGSPAITWVGAAGSYLVATTSTAITIYNSSLIAVWSAAGTGPLGLDAVTGSILIVDSVGNWFVVNTSTWATSGTGTLTGMTTPVTGTFRCCITGALEDGACITYCSATASYWTNCAFPTISSGFGWNEFLSTTHVYGNVSLLLPAKTKTYKSVLLIQAEGQEHSAVGPYKTVGGICTESTRMMSIGNPQAVGIVPLTAPVRVVNGATFETYVWLGIYQADNGAYCQLVLMGIRYDGSSLQGFPISILARGSTLGSKTAWCGLRGNLLVSRSFKYDEFGYGLATVFGVPFARTIEQNQQSQVGIDLGIVEHAPASWVTSDVSHRPIDFARTVKAQGISLVGGALPRRMGSLVEPLVDCWEPSSPTCSLPGTDAGPGAGTYQYRLVCRFEDSAGNVYQGPVSNYTQIANPNGYKVRVRVYGLYMAGTRSWIDIYRDNGAGGGVFRRVTTTSGIPMPSIYTDFDDTVVSETWESQELMYTLTERGPVSGRLSTWGPPAHSFSDFGMGRLILGGLERSTRVTLSDLSWATEGIQFLDSPAHDVDIQEPVTAVAVLGEAFLIGTRRGWSVFYGPGPDSTGVGQFTDPKDIGCSCGPISHRSLAKIDKGLIYQGTDGHLYLIDRASLTVSCLSQSAQYWIDRDPAVDALTVAPSRLVACTAKDERTGSWLLCMRPAYGAASTGSSITWLDPVTLGMSRDTGACNQTSVLDKFISAFIYNGETVLTRHGATSYLLVQRSYTSSLVGQDRNGTATTTQIELSSIAPFGLGGWGKVRRIYVGCSLDGLPAARAGGGLSLLVSFDGYETTEETLTVAQPTSMVGLTQFDFCPARQKCQSILLVTADSSAGKLKKYHGVTLDVQPIGRGAIRTRSGSVRA